MNNKIKNYVDVLFSDVPNTRKSIELKEEILSNLNEHFEQHIAEGMSENQAYTECLKDLGNVDELLSSLTPDRELKKDIDKYKTIKAKNMSISVGLLVLGLVAVAVADYLGDMSRNDDLWELIGCIVMFLCWGGAIALIIYTKISAPDDVQNYMSKSTHKKTSKPTGDRTFDAIMGSYWAIVVALYFIVSFATGAWHITWIIYLIAPAFKNFLYAIYGEEDND